MSYTYEEVRDATLDLLSGRERQLDGYGVSLNQYRSLERAVADLLVRRNSPTGEIFVNTRMHPQTSDFFREVFWDLFRQGIIIPGIDSANENLPFFSVTAHGHRVLKGQQPYYFYDVESYERVLRTNIPAIDGLTLLYLKEAMQAFRSNCLLSASVMLGVATEHLFMVLLEIIEKHPIHQATYKNVFKERTLLQRFSKFRALLGQDMKSLPTAVREDLDVTFDGILTVIRNHRNESGHPSGKFIDRETCYVLLHLFITHGKKLMQLSDYFKQPVNP